jgi:hypothetical protein
MVKVVKAYLRQPLAHAYQLRLALDRCPSLEI